MVAFLSRDVILVSLVATDDECN